MSKKIEVAIVGDASNYIRSLRSAEGSTGRFGGTLGKLKVAAAGAALGGVAVLGKFLVDSVHAAEASEVAHARLVTAFKAVGLSADAYSKQIDTAEGSMRKLGFTDEQTMTSLGSLVAATHNVKAAVADMSTAADLARFKHIELSDATKMLTMAMTGSQRAVKQLGITISPVTTAVDALKRSQMDLTTESGRAALAHAQLLDKMATGQEVIAKTSDLVKGQSQAYADTAAGGMAKFHAQLDHLQVALGEVLLPTLGRAAKALADFLINLNSLLAPLRSVKSWIDNNAAASKALGLAWTYLLNPLAFVKRDMVALNAVITAGKAAFDGIRAAASAVSHFFEGALAGAVSATQALIRGAAATVKAFDTAFDGVKGAAKAVASFFEGGLTSGL